ncbi:MAG: TonB-dependent receptor [Thermoanaerobaculia bacterium]
MSRVSRLLVLSSLVLWMSAPLAAAFEVRLFLPGRGAAAGFTVSVVGQPLTAVTDAEGRLTLDPSPALPFVIVATSPSGETSAPFEVADLAVGEIVLPEVLRESVTVVSGVAPGIDLLPAAAATVVTHEELEQRAPQRLFQALESVVGTSKLGDGADSVLAVRNLGRGRTLIQIDGARVSAERRAGPSATFVDPATLSAVEVARGPGSVVYGSDAFGGVVNAVTRDPDLDRFALSYGVEGAFDAADEASGFVAASLPVGAGAVLVEGQYREAGDFQAGGGEEIFNSGYTTFGGGLRYLLPLPAGRLRLGLNIDRVEDLGKAAIDSRQIRAYYPNENSDRLTASWIGSAGTWDALEGSAFYGTYDIVLDRDRAPTATSNRRIDRADTQAKDASARFVAGRALAGGRLQAGLDLVTRFDLQSVFSQSRYAADGTTVTRVDRFPAIDDAQKFDGGLFATWSRPLADRVSLALGARGDYVESENSGGYFGDRSSDTSAFSGNASMAFGPYAGWTTTAQMARGFRTPTLSDLYFRGPSGRGFVIGNPDLEPETSLQLDLGTRWRSGKTAIGLFAYHYEIDNLIERYSAGDNFQFRNRGQGTIEGIEVEVQTVIAEDWSLEGGIAVSDGSTDGGTEIDDIAPPNGWVTLRYSFATAYLFGRVTSFLAQDEPGPTELARDGYTLFDLGGGYRFSEAIELRLMARNLGDKRYYAAADNAADLATGRIVSLAISGRF